MFWASTNWLNLHSIACKWIKRTNERPNDLVMHKPFRRRAFILIEWNVSFKKLRFFVLDLLLGWRWCGTHKNSPSKWCAFIFIRHWYIHSILFQLFQWFTSVDFPQIELFIRLFFTSLFIPSHPFVRLLFFSLFFSLFCWDVSAGWLCR